MKKTELFTHVPVKKVNRNFFDLSHEVKMSAKFTYLYPVLLQECIPGDEFRNTSTVFMRLAPMLAPVMHRVNVTVHYFYVPMRLVVGENLWENFITGGQNGDLVPVLPYATPAGINNAYGSNVFMEKGGLWDYMGLPVMPAGADPADSTEQISVLPFRVYEKIWNDYYRDPNFDDEANLHLELEGNASSFTFFALKRRGWRKDYFTAALPFAQRGASVLLPLSGTATDSDGDISWKSAATFQTSAGANFSASNLQIVAGTASEQAKIKAGAGTPEQGRLKNIDSITFDNQVVTINDFRTALAIQSWLENNARGGGRYIEQIQAHFNVRVQDYRLQRAEYLGGGVQPVQISEVLATAKAVDVPVGDMAGHGVSVGKTNQFSYFCREHGYIMGIMSVMPETAYQQGIEKLWSRKTKFDFAWPEMAHLGEQEILSKELFFGFYSDMDTSNNSTFGYIPRYSEYKFKNDRVAGDFRDTLAFWHLGRIFDADERPILDEVFTTADENPDNEASMRRIFAVEDDTDYLWINIFHKLTAKRPLPYFGVPKLIG